MIRKNRHGSVEPSLDVLGSIQYIIRQVREGKKTKEQLQAFLENRCFCKKKAEVSAVIPFKHDKTKDGWRLLEDAPFDGELFVPEFVEFLKPGEPCVNGEAMKQRAKELKVHSGQRHAEWLLEHQENIPKELRGNCLVFPNTVWRGGIGNQRGISYLCWLGGQWRLRFGWLKGGWGGNDRLVRLHG